MKKFNGKIVKTLALLATILRLVRYQIKFQHQKKQHPLFPQAYGLPEHPNKSKLILLGMNIRLFGVIHLAPSVKRQILRSNV